MGRQFLYARTSTVEQFTQNQVLEVQAAGFQIEPYRIFQEEVSGKVPAMERKVFCQILDRMEPGDELVVTKLDRIGRDVMDVTATVRLLASRGIKVHCIALGGMDLTSPAGKMTMNVLAAVAEFERDLLVERTQAGLERAKAEGVELGRKKSYTPKQAEEIRVLVKDKKNWSIRKLAKHYGLSAGTVQRIVQQGGFKPRAHWKQEELAREFRELGLTIAELEKALSLPWGEVIRALGLDDSELDEAFETKVRRETSAIRKQCEAKLTAWAESEEAEDEAKYEAQMNDDWESSGDD